MPTIRELREQKGISQGQIASYLGISRQTYARYERCPELLSIDQAQILCGLLGCDFDTLVPVEVCLTNVPEFQLMRTVG